MLFSQCQVKELFGVSPAALKSWKNNPSNTKYKLGKFLVSLDYINTKKDLKELDLLEKNAI